MTERLWPEPFRVGPIRPPSEAESLLLQITAGCTWNKCKFCNLYRGTPFKAFSVDEAKNTIDKMAAYRDIICGFKLSDCKWDMTNLYKELRSVSDPYKKSCAQQIAYWVINGGKTVFLQDGNAMVLSNGKLSDVLNYLKRTFPTIERITSYARAKDLARLSVEDLILLKESGLTRIHSGYESGDDQVLDIINKGVTQMEEIEAGKKVKAAGIQLSLYFMPGIGGKKFSEKNAKGMAKVVREVNPDFLRIRTTAIKENTELYEDYSNNIFQMASDDDKIKEIRTLIVEARNVGTEIKSDHIVNLLPDIEGNIGEEKERLLSTIDEYLELSEKERKLFQYARRMNMVNSVREIGLLEASTKETIYEKIAQSGNEDFWNHKINRMISRYI